MKGFARILLRDTLVNMLPMKIEKPKAGRVAWDWMEVKELAGTFQEVLLLPEGYSIIGVFFDIARNTWSLIVESSDIPPQNEGEMLSILMPAYERLSDGTVRLLDMKLEK